MRYHAAAFAMVLVLSARTHAGPPPPRYFPLDPGNRWTYVEERFGGKFTITVLSFEGDAYRVDFGGHQALIRGFPDALDVELPGEGFVPYYRFQEDSFVHRDFRPCDDRATLTAGARNEKVETPAGVFDGCLRLDFQPAGGCADIGTASEWWQPEVGLVQWTELWIGGERPYLLEKFERLGPRAPFLRGDADGSQTVEITDAVFTLNALFTGGPEPPCEDPADSNDDGALNVSDPIFLLGSLFLGSERPPFPGSEVAGFDGTPGDPFTCGDSPLPTPEPAATSSLPGVSLDLSGNPPVITLAQAAAGVEFVYRTRIETNLAAVTSTPLDAGRCDRPDASGLAVLEMITGDRTYCLCDTGRCGLGDSPVDLVPGVYEASFEWDGREWSGPSDTGRPKGDPFPPGTYQIRITAAGTYPGDGGSEIPWEVAGTVAVHLVP